MNYNSPECCVVQRCISVFILGLNAAVGLQQDLHYFHMALVSSHLEGRLPLVLYIHLQTISQYIIGSFLFTEGRCLTGINHQLCM